MCRRRARPHDRCGNEALVRGQIGCRLRLKGSAESSTLLEITRPTDFLRRRGLRNCAQMKCVAHSSEPWRNWIKRSFRPDAGAKGRALRRRTR